MGKSNNDKEFFDVEIGEPGEDIVRMDVSRGYEYFEYVNPT